MRKNTDNQGRLLGLFSIIYLPFYIIYKLVKDYL